MTGLMMVSKRRKLIGKYTPRKSQANMSLKSETVATLRKSIHGNYMRDDVLLEEPNKTNHSDDTLMQDSLLQFIEKEKVLEGYSSNDAPWNYDSRYFSSVAISRLACTKVLEHSLNGGNMEVMGMLIGFTMNKRFVVFDSFELPVEGTETRVNAQTESYEYMVQYVDEMVPENQNIVGWYHSHPGYDCWLSNIDMHTQQLNQSFQDPYIAIVVDPHRSLKEHKLRIGAFRTVRGSGVQEVHDKGRDGNNENDALEFYELKISIFESKYDSSWNSHRLKIETPKFDLLGGNLLIQKLLDTMKQWNNFNEIIGETRVDEKGNTKFKKDRQSVVEREYSITGRNSANLSRRPSWSNPAFSITSNENESDMDIDIKNLGEMDNVSSSIHTMTDPMVQIGHQTGTSLPIPRRIFSNLDNASRNANDEGQVKHIEALRADYIINRRELLNLKLWEYEQLRFFRDTFTNQNNM